LLQVFLHLCCGGTIWTLICNREIALASAVSRLIEPPWKIQTLINLTADAEITTQGGIILTKLPAAVLTFVCPAAARSRCSGRDFD